MAALSVISKKNYWWLGGALVAIICADALLMQSWYHWSAVIAWQDSIVSNAILAMACFLVSSNVAVYYPSDYKYLYVIILSVISASLWIIVLLRILKLLESSQHDYLSFLSNSIPLRFGYGLIVILACGLVSLLDRKIRELTKARVQEESLERMSREAELYKLRNQLHPHFLFNSLNSISSLIITRPEEAREMIQKLSDFLRGTVKKEEQQWTSLQDEIRYLQLYLDIEKIRFGHRLQTKLDCSEASLAQKLPNMLLQPVVENAIKFGLYGIIEDVLINIQTYEDNGWLYIKIENPFDPESQPSKGTGFGLSGIRRRLFLLFGRNDLLITQQDDNIFITSIKIPQYK